MESPPLACGGSSPAVSPVSSLPGATSTIAFDVYAATLGAALDPHWTAVINPTIVLALLSGALVGLYYSLRGAVIKLAVHR